MKTFLAELSEAILPLLCVFVCGKTFASLIYGPGPVLSLGATSMNDDRQQLTVLTLFGFAAVFLFIVVTGCTTASPHPAAKDVVAIEASAVAIDANDNPTIDTVDEDVERAPNPETDTSKCVCCENCACGDRCICVMGEPCSKECSCYTPPADPPPRLPWNGQPLYPTPFWCYQCQDFSYWLAPVTCQKTQCKHCRKFRAVRTRFQNQPNYQQQGSGGKVNWFGNPKIIRPWRNGLFMDAEAGAFQSATC